ncbi:ROK family protein [Marispirochaeta sp.]|jgi:glucokinase|uniref:ROK family protein n=1 Tax=Marispirochaeta sp. TaxID=2038653 RepID=UPI0029C85CA8|nr:ROK family protein [Marispirochaeta sp.]
MGTVYWIGFDLGGTKMIASLLDENYAILGRVKKRTDPHEGNSAVLKRIAAAIEEVILTSGVPRSAIKGIGFAAPGPMDREAGIMISTPNLGFENIPIRSYLEEEAGIKVCLDNDVNAGTFGEFIKGAGKGYRHLLGVFLGTGIGGGLIINGQMYRGANGNAGEVGHMILQTDGPLCGCGQYGCLEALASRRSLAKDAVALASSGKAPVLLNMAGTDIAGYKSGVFAKALKKQDPAAKEIIKRGAFYLGIGLANCVNMLNPEAIILGGGLVEKLGTPFLKQIVKSLRAHSLPGLIEDVKVMAAELGDDAALVGSAALAALEFKDQ